MKSKNEINPELLNEINSDPRMASMLDHSYMRKKLIMWIVRTAILITLYMLFWKYESIRWTLYITVPFASISLLMIFFLPKIVNKKLAQTSEVLNQISESEVTYTLEDYKAMYADMERDVIEFKELATKVNHHKLHELCDGFFNEKKLTDSVMDVEDAEAYYNELVGYIYQIEEIIESEGLDELFESNDI